MPNAIIVHGKPSYERYMDPDGRDPSDSHWLPWAKHQLSIRGIDTSTPDMPKPYDPDFDRWSEEFERYKVNAETVLVGLSAGAGFLVEWLSADDRVVDKLILVAPWTNPNHKYGNFFTAPIDEHLAERCLGGLTVFHSSYDDEQTQRSFAQIVEALPTANIIDIPEYGHFMLGNTMENIEFPELIEEIIDN